MARTLVDYVKVYATNTGTGPLQLGAAVPGFDGIGALTDTATYGYSIRQGSNWEVGQGVYSLADGTLTRVIEKSSNGGAAINLGPNAIINFPALAADISRPGPAGPPGPQGDQGPPGSGGVDPSLVMYKANNLSDLVDKPASRANLGLARTTITATAGQTAFTAAYAVGRILVFLNGVLLAAADYTATSGTEVDLASAAAAGDIVDIVSI